MDQSIKETLLERLRAYLDAADAPEADVSQAADAIEMVADLESDAVTDEARDLFSVFVEIAATRNEVRTQSRIVKDALDQFRDVFATLQSANTALDRELKEAHARAREQTRTVLRPLLLDILDVRDRLAAGLAAAPPRRASPWRPWRRPSRDPWREGLEMTLQRFDRVLADRRVTPIATIGRPLTPNVARVVGTRDDPFVTEGLVIAESRTGFEWEGELLRVAEVIVAKRTSAKDKGTKDRSDRGDDE
ncbi:MULTISPECIES: nucleotide exchange factor GrpE [unclassified Bradyrhizobium]|uniref:nucleotide exchange factor GrpE n=1 Tax=unclassified Bradyrhizobium TaxID=2631580 RepID=UPI0020B41EBF|nr:MULTISPECIES: nucleotide exchange factor GrpE [unclassified Bradyrhizobium]MCP3468262.1 nucleotide exchange factor GrpE [Bradyrhizobium sp. CCGUVB23]MCP3477778.1 nucleotide exchange factor GrpE [Bradyrhizobium sp. CCGUVB1N3]